MIIPIFSYFVCNPDLYKFCFGGTYFQSIFLANIYVCLLTRVYSHPLKPHYLQTSYNQGALYCTIFINSSITNENKYGLNADLRLNTNFHLKSSVSPRTCFTIVLASSYTYPVLFLHTTSSRPSFSSNPSTISP